MKIFVKAKPSAKGEKIEKLDEGRFIVSVKEPPIRGRANQAIIKALAKYFNAPSFKITIIAGRASKNKICEIQD